MYSSCKRRLLTRTFMVELAGDCDAGDGVVAGFIPGLSGRRRGKDG